MSFKSWVKENRWTLFIHLILTISCFCLGFFVTPFIKLSENQILYYFSTSAQVIAGLYGLTLTGYIFLNDRLNKTVEEDDSYFDVVEELKSQQHIKITVMGILCIASIFTCILIINTYNGFSIYKVFNFLLNQATVIILTELIVIVKFSWEAVNPKSYSKINEKLRENNDYSGEEKEGSLAEFIKFYNLLEGLIIEWSNTITQNNNRYSKNNNRKYRPSIMESLRILYSKEKIDKDIIDKINELRIYRNTVVHGTEVKVSTEACKQIEELYNFFKNLLEKE